MSRYSTSFSSERIPVVVGATNWSAIFFSSSFWLHWFHPAAAWKIWSAILPSKAVSTAFEVACFNFSWRAVTASSPFSRSFLPVSRRLSFMASSRSLSRSRLITVSNPSFWHLSCAISWSRLSLCAFNSRIFSLVLSASAETCASLSFASASNASRSWAHWRLISSYCCCISDSRCLVMANDWIFWAKLLSSKILSNKLEK